MINESTIDEQLQTCLELQVMWETSKEDTEVAAILAAWSPEERKLVLESEIIQTVSPAFQAFLIDKLVPKVPKHEAPVNLDDLDPKALIERGVHLLTQNNNGKDAMPQVKQVLTKLSAKLPAWGALFEQLMEKVKTEACDEINEAFLMEYLTPFEPAEVLAKFAHLCLPVKAGNGKAYRTLFACLNTKLELLPYKYVEDRIHGIDSPEDEAVVRRMVQSLEAMNHTFCPQAMCSLAEHFYRKITRLQSEDEKRQSLAKAIKIILKVENADNIAPQLKDGIMVAYGNHMFPRKTFIHAEDVFTFVDLNNLAELTLERLQDACQKKQAQLAKEEALAQQQSAQAPAPQKRRPPPPPPLPEDLEKKKEEDKLLKRRKDELSGRCRALYALWTLSKSDKEMAGAFARIIFTEDDIAFIFKENIIASFNNPTFEGLLIKKLIEKLGNQNILKEIAILAVRSPNYKGHGHPVGGFEYNQQEWAAQKSIEKITDPTVLLALLKKLLSQASAIKNVSGLVVEVTTRITSLQFAANSNIQVVYDAIKAMLAVLHQIPVWSKSSDAHLTPYLKSVETLFSTIAYHKDAYHKDFDVTVRNYFVAVHKTKVGILNLHPGKLSQNLNIVLTQCEDMLEPVYRRYYNNYQAPCDQKALMDLCMELLTVTGNKTDLSGNKRIITLRNQITDQKALFETLMKKIKTEACDGMNREFLMEYLQIFTPAQVLMQLVPLCMPVKQGNGNAYRIVVSCLDTKLDMVSRNYVEERIRKCSVQDEAEVMCMVQCLESMNHTLYPHAVSLLAEYFYKKSKEVPQKKENANEEVQSLELEEKEEDEKQKALENALKMICKTSGPETVDLKNKLIVAYGNHFFPAQHFIQAQAVFDFLEIKDTAGLTVEWLQDAIVRKQREHAQATKAFVTVHQQSAPAVPAVPVDEVPVRMRTQQGNTAPAPVLMLSNSKPIKDAADTVMAEIVEMRRGILASVQEAVQKAAKILAIAIDANAQFSDQEIKAIIEQLNAAEKFCTHEKCPLSVEAKQAVINAITPCRDAFMNKQNIVVPPAKAKVAAGKA